MTFKIRLIRRFSSRFRQILLFVFVFSSIFLFTVICYNPDLVIQRNGFESYTLISKEENIEKFAIKTQVCSIPAMQPISKMIQQFVYYPEKLEPCPNTDNILLQQNGSHIWITEDSRILNHYKIVKRKHFACCYHSFYRPDYIQDIYSESVDERIVYNDCIYFNEIITVNDEFVRVRCFTKQNLVYDQFFLFVSFKTLTSNDEEKGQINEPEKQKYNVLVLGLDDISRLNFHRTMPKTSEFMKNRGAVELMGYNKVGDNSFPNLVPFLMGYAKEEIKEVCHPVKMTTFDDCPFLWNWYKDAGFYTAFGEDSGLLGTFNYFMKGFRKTPTDYYLHPFIAEAERYAGKKRDYNAFLCMNEHYFYQILLDYIQNLAETLFDYNLFGFFWETTMSHDDLNYPMVMDNSYLQFFKRLESSEYLDKTIIFLVSDHGIRWGPFRKTWQGYLEERLPLAYLLMPPSFREVYSEAFNNLIYNSRQLTTPFDMHETLLDLIDLKNIQNETIFERSKEMYANNRGISLFLEIPQNRTCKSAGIADHWCTCHKRMEISNKTKEAASASEHLIYHLNSLLSKYPKCVNLALDEILNVVEILTDLREELNDIWREYSVVVKVKPSGGVFESTLRHSDTWSVVGTVSRLNLYRNQSHCVHDPHLKLYCYCAQNDNKA